jgi:hypothetical protein
MWAINVLDSHFRGNDRGEYGNEKKSDGDDIRGCGNDRRGNKFVIKCYSIKRVF